MKRETARKLTSVRRECQYRPGPYGVVPVPVPVPVLAPAPASASGTRNRIGIRIREKLVMHRGKPVTLLPNVLGSLAVYRCTAE